MLRTFGWFYRLLGLGRVMGRVRLGEHSAEIIRKAQDKGPVVYVMLRRSTLDQLALNSVLLSNDLPLAVWSNGPSTFWWQPIKDAWKGVFFRIKRLFQGGRGVSSAVHSGWLKTAVASDATTAVFLRRRADSPTPAPEDDPLHVMLEVQRESEAPIQLVPIIAMWNRSPEQHSAVRTFLLGSHENPSIFSKLQNLYVPLDKGPFIQVGEPLDLQQLVQRVPEDRQLLSLRTLLRRYLRREEKTIRGPTLLPKRVLKKVVLNNPPMRNFAAEHAAETGSTTLQVQDKMAKEFDLIAANFSWNGIRILSHVTAPLWTRIYQGYDIRETDLEHIREAMRGGATVLAPTHKSHFDYLLLSWVLYQKDLIVPHIVAGVNLAIWPVSIILRSAGAFFIKRSFAKEPIHPVVFERYVRELLRHGYPVEFFIEGGRTRTGQLLRPKLGVLGMVVDATAKNTSDQPALILPMNISYEKVAEESAYQSEQSGAEKKKESLGQLFKAGRLFGSRFGKVYIRANTPIDLRAVLETVPNWNDLSEQEKRPHLRRLGEEIVYAMGRVAVVLPTTLVALALLAHPAQGIRHTELYDRVLRLRSFLARQEALESKALERFEQAITQALARFEDQGMIKPLGTASVRVWKIEPDQRVTLDFHKNQVMQFFAPAGLAVVALRTLNSPKFSREDLIEPFTALCGILDREFVFPPDQTLAQRLDEGLEQLHAYGAIVRDDEGWSLGAPELLTEMHGLMAGWLQSYLLVATYATRFVDEGADYKSLPKAFLSHAEEFLASGEVNRPEALGLSALKNAINSYRDDGWVTPRGDTIELDTEALRKVVEQLRQMVA